MFNKPFKWEYGTSIVIWPTRFRQDLKIIHLKKADGPPYGGPPNFHDNGVLGVITQAVKSTYHLDMEMQVIPEGKAIPETLLRKLGR